MEPVKRLDKLAIDESSGVDKPANLSPGWVVIKGEGDTKKPPGFFKPHAYVNNDPEKNGAKSCDICGAAANAPMHQAAKTKKEGRMPPDIDRDELAPEVLAVLEDAEARLAKAESDLAAATKPPEPPKEDVGKGEIPEAVQKALDESDRLRKAAEDKATEMEKSVTAANERLAKMERKEREGEYIAKARDLGNLSTSPNTLGTLLLDISEKVEADTFKQLDQLLKAANAQLEKGALFATIGDAEGETADTTLDARITKAATEMLAKGQAPTIEQAKLAVLKSDSALRSEYDAARRAR